MSVDNYDDLNELADDDGIDNDGDSELFHEATAYVQSAASGLDSAVLLKLYAFYKQAMDGPCTQERPSWYDFRAKSKWEAWHALGGLGKQEARTAYVTLVQDLSGRARAEAGVETAGGGGAKSTWVTHSTLHQYGEEEDGDKEADPTIKSLLDHVTADNLPAIKQLLSEQPRLLSTVSGHDRLTLLHFAADRGSSAVLEYLLSLAAASDLIGARDRDGQTALHYAAACGHTLCCQMLLTHGADAQAQDNDGTSCVEAAADDKTAAILLRK